MNRLPNVLLSLSFFSILVLNSCGTGICPFGGCATVLSDGIADEDHRIFLSSATTDGNISGLTGADAFCQSLANAAGLTRTYKAILSDDTATAVSRLSFTGSLYLFTASNTPEKVLDDASDLFNAAAFLLRTLSVDEQFNSYGLVGVWTGSSAVGTTTTLDCADWTNNVAGNGTVGGTNSTNNQWINLAPDPCGDSNHLYCVSQ